MRALVLVVPFAASIAFAFLLSGLLPTVSTVPMAILRWLLIALLSTSVMIAFDRLTRRLLPLAALFSLTLAFPDQAPSRFKIAMRTGTTLQLRKVVADAHAGRIGATPAEAAEKLLELVAALSLHDRLTRGHAERVRAYTHMVGEELKITGAELDHLRWSALLHDIGKLLISPAILNKAGALTDAEYEVVKQHPELGRQLVTPLVAWLGDASRAVWEHHERWDGLGYPRGLAGTEISRAGRIVAVTDAFDVMTSARSYKDPISPVAARAELARCAGSHFDAAIVRAFLNVSLGRLRMAMGPLSWLTQLSFVPQALVTAGASGATAVTAIVGLGAGAIGVGLSDDGVISAAETEQTASPATSDVDDVTGQPFEVGGTTPGPDDGGGGGGDYGVGDDGVAGTPTTSSVPIGGQETSTTSTVPTGTTVALVSGGTTTAPPTAPGPPTTAPPTTAPGATAPGTTAPTAAVTTAPVTTASATTAPVTTAPPATAPLTAPPTTTATTAPPAPMQDLTLYLTSPGTGAVAWQQFLTLTTELPLLPLGLPFVPNYDTDRDNEPALTLRRLSGSHPDRSEQSFRWAAPQAVLLRGSVEVVLHATGKNNDNGSITLDVQLRSCRGAICTEISAGSVSANSPFLGYTTMTFDLGPIEAQLAAGDALELVILAPDESERDVWLAYDTATTPSRLVFRQT